jgi:hypothetical protein
MTTCVYHIDILFIPSGLFASVIRLAKSALYLQYINISFNYVYIIIKKVFEEAVLH